MDVDHDRFFVRTNEGAPRYRVFKVDPAHPDRDAGPRSCPSAPTRPSRRRASSGTSLALRYLKDVVSHAEMRRRGRQACSRRWTCRPSAPRAASSGDADDDLAYYAFQSFTYPTEIFETSVKTGKTTSLYQLKVPVDPSKYVVEQHFVDEQGRDAHAVLRRARKASAPDGKTPTILTATAGFQVAKTPYFSSAVFPWLEQGGIWVCANLRGGSEYGEEWHRHGMRHEKQNVFDDLFAVAEEL